MTHNGPTPDSLPESGKLPRLLGQPIIHLHADIAKGKDKYLLSIGPRFYIVNKLAHCVVHGLYTFDTLDQLHQELCNARSITFTREELQCAIDRLHPTMFEPVEGSSRKTSLRFVIPLLGERHLAAMTRFTQWPFTRAGFGTLLVAAVALFWSRWDSMSFTAWKLQPLVLASSAPLLLLGALIHELGHASAAQRFGASPKGIGFALSSAFLPGFYIDATPAWSLSRRERVVVDAAGCYFQILYSAVCLGVSTLVATGGEALACATMLNLSAAIGNMLPVFELDGYWLLVDSLNHPKLQETSFQYWKATFSGKRPTGLTASLALYSGLVCTSIAMATISLWLLAQESFHSSPHTEWPRLLAALMMCSSLLTLIRRPRQRGDSK